MSKRSKNFYNNSKSKYNHYNEDSLEEFSEEELNDKHSEGEGVEDKDNKLSESEEKQKNISK
ncbi:7499_t:CDS:1, partial [Funneliformis geosporum]